ncbi:hypothetical protein [Rhizorhabdus dicambivorans]|uniref:Uncharacterized protein n=1 Tax=Rhizorhabdus dicambivorans TaxID=1850238 RepID=A0A2A4FYY1_9SPHN|nr:hypothetical protein [Rhizorhabdus dicambivorans]ATE64089.1 hypothetical protein CMV14_06535 [Rhizorhabdus dicambivorans]PCE42637.1 hypothetical protein COO09_09540 [Rhizorhabdus dicambivorans]
MKMYLAAMLISVSTAASADTLHLVCLGAGAANRQSSTSAYGFDSNGNSAWANALSDRSVGFDDQVDVEINEGGASRIRLPRAMLPRLRGGKDGWFELADVKFSDMSITGTAQVNFINSPKVHLDRRTGHISINGKAGDFSGECRKFDPAKVERAF